MIKYLFIFINTLVLSVLSFFSGGSKVTLSHNIPTTIAVGHEANVEVVISKGDLNGFGRLQMEFPEGISIKHLESQGAAFTFENGIAKWVWGNVPQEDRFVVKMVLVASEPHPGVHSVKGKYSYVENNVKQVVEMPPAELNETTAEEASASIRTIYSIPSTLESMQESLPGEMPSGDNGVSITHNIPATIAAGQDIPVQIKIKKGDLNGFAKLQIDLPEGITLKENEETGASFTNEDGIAKWVWAAVPTESDVIVKFVIVASESAVGVKNINARYSFVENNVKQVVEMTTAEVNVTMPSAVTSAMPAVTNNSGGRDSTVTKQADKSSNSEPAGNITVKRKITSGTTPNEFIVSVFINKDSTKGFARYSDDIKEGITARAIETNGSSFTVADGKLKFVWVNVPEGNEMKVSYALSGSSAEPLILNGEYSYLDQNLSKKYLLDPESIAFQSQTVAKETGKDGVEKAEPVNETKEKDEPVKEPKSTKKDKKEKQKAREELAITSKKEGEISYRVQIGAFKNAKVTTNTLVKKFAVKETIHSEMQEGFTKFMIGSHDLYKSAHEQREIMKNENKIRSAFVVAYNGGKRITVQEGLMITNQKWFK